MGQRFYCCRCLNYAILHFYKHWPEKYMTFFFYWLQLWPRSSQETHFLDHCNRRQRDVGVHLLYQPISGAALHRLQNPGTRKDVSIPAVAAVSIYIIKFFIKQSFFPTSGLCMWTWWACGWLWVWRCFLASPCTPFTRTVTLWQTVM